MRIPGDEIRAFRARATLLQKAPIGAGRRRYAEYIEGLRSKERDFDPHRPYQSN